MNSVSDSKRQSFGWIMRLTYPRCNGIKRLAGNHPFIHTIVILCHDRRRKSINAVLANDFCIVFPGGGRNYCIAQLVVIFNQRAACFRNKLRQTAIGRSIYRDSPFINLAFAVQVRNYTRFRERRAHCIKPLSIGCIANSCIRKG